MLNEIIQYGPIVFACMVGFNAAMAGFYTALSKLVESAKVYSGNVYLQIAAGVCKKIMTVIDIIGMNPQRVEVKKQIEQNKADIEAIKDKV